MADSNVSIEVKGIKELNVKLNKLGVSLEKYAQQGFVEASKDILKTEGIQKYPPSTDANLPPTPYYKRGMGMQYKTRNNGKSERYGTQWHVDKVKWGIKIANRASYAKYLTGDKEQARVMARIGWKKISDVVKDRMPKIKKTVNAWIKQAIKKAGL